MWEPKNGMWWLVTNGLYMWALMKSVLADVMQQHHYTTLTYSHEYTNTVGTQMVCGNFVLYNMFVTIKEGYIKEVEVAYKL